MTRTRYKCAICGEEVEATIPAGVYQYHHTYRNSAGTTKSVISLTKINGED